MAGPYKEAERRLSALAQTQQGLFTTKQAIHAGFAEKTHAYHVRSGNWIRQQRGIYRLADVASGERPDLTLWYLWSQNRNEIPEGTYSHETALSLHELSDIMPSKLQMTVPEHFRRSGRAPAVLELHWADLGKAEIQEMHGVRVTRPLRTIADLMKTGRVDGSQLKRAVREALERGLVSRQQMDALPDAEMRNALRKLAGRSR